jgi:hypothetical protein
VRVLTHGLIVEEEEEEGVEGKKIPFLFYVTDHKAD